MKELTVGRIISRMLLAVFLTFDLVLYVDFLNRLTDPATKVSIVLIVIVSTIWVSNLIGMVYLPDFRNGGVGSIAAAGWIAGLITHILMVFYVMGSPSVDNQAFMFLPYLSVVAESMIRPVCYEVLKKY